MNHLNQKVSVIRNYVYSHLTFTYSKEKLVASIEHCKNIRSMVLDLASPQRCCLLSY